MTVSLDLECDSFDQRDVCKESTASQDEGRKSQNGVEAPVEILDWDGPNDPGNPYNWSRTRKWMVAGAVLFMTLILPLNGTSITVSAAEINQDFGVSDASFPHSYWPVTSWSLGGAFFVLFFLPIMEDIGVRWGSMIFYVFFLLMIIPQALATNFATLIVTRFLTGGCVSLLANVISSIIPDLWESEAARSMPISVFILLYLNGNTLGPVIFAAVPEYIGNWRWIFYIQLILYTAYMPIFFLLLKETRGNVILASRARTIRKETGRLVYAKAGTHETAMGKIRQTWTSASRPMYLLLTEPVLLAVTLWSAFSFGMVFVFTQSVTQVYMTLYGWQAYETGYVQSAIVIGQILGWLLAPYGHRLYFRSARHNSETPGKPVPEARLYLSVPASLAGIVGGMFIYGWTSYPNIPWIAPTIGLAMVGFGIQIVVSSVADYIIDLYSPTSYAGSAICGCAAGENIAAGFLPLSAQSLYTNLGFQWASTLLAFLAILLSIAPLVFVFKGHWFRKRSPFMLAGMSP